ncbi:6379_t:CDS:1, partial [Gigaspora rosea]
TVVKYGIARITAEKDLERTKRKHGTRQRINLELYEVINSLKEIKPEERDEETYVYMMNVSNESLLLIPEELMPLNSEEEHTTDKNDNQLDANTTSMMIFELVSPRYQKKLVFVETYIDNGHEYYLYLHPTSYLRYPLCRKKARPPKSIVPRRVYHIFAHRQ